MFSCTWCWAGSFYAGFVRQESHNDGVARLYGYTLLACASVGLVDEIYQAILPNRTFNWYDVVLNAVGGSLAVIWAWLGEGNSSQMARKRSTAS